MKDIVAEVYVPWLVSNGFYPDDSNKEFCREGICYTLHPDKGEGYFWAYGHHHLYSVYVQDFVLYDDVFLQHRQPEHLCVTYLETLSHETLKPYQRDPCNCAQGQVSCGNLYPAVYPKNTPIRSTGIMIIPELYQDYLNTTYCGERIDLRSIIIGLHETTDFPELTLLMRQIRNYRGTGISAKLFFEGKVAEALSLIIEKTQQAPSHLVERSISHQDRVDLAPVIRYINEHFASDIHLEQLARISCMGITKLKYAFKQAHHSTITAYIQNKRMRHAEHLIANTELNIHQISTMVGYINASRFCALFRKHTGLTPNEYRKRIKSTSPISAKLDHTERRILSWR